MFKKQILVRAREQLEVPNTNNSANDWPRAAAPKNDGNSNGAMPSSSAEQNMIRMNTAFAVPQLKENIAATTSINSNDKRHEETTASCTVTPDENDSGETTPATHRLPLQQQEHNNALSNPFQTTSCTATFQGESYPAMEVAAREELQRRTKKPQQHDETTTIDDSTSQEELAAAIALVGLSPQSSQSLNTHTTTTDLREVVRRITPDNATAETSQDRDSKRQQQQQQQQRQQQQVQQQQASKETSTKIITPPIDDTIISITIHENARTTTQDDPIHKTPIESKAIMAISDHSTIETKESSKANNLPDVPPVRRHSDSTIETKESSKANNLPRIENVPPGRRYHYEADSTDESLEEHPQPLDVVVLNNSKDVSTVLPKTTTNIKDGATATKTDTSTAAKALEESLEPKHEENLASDEKITVVEIGKEPPALLARSESKHVETIASNKKITIVEIQNEPTALLARSKSVVLSNEPPLKHNETLTSNENFTIELRKDPTAMEAQCDPGVSESQAATEQSSKSSKPLPPKEPTNAKQAPVEEESVDPCKKKADYLLKKELSKLESHCGEGIHWAPVTGKRRRKSSSLCEAPTKKAPSLHNSQLIGKRKRGSSLCDAPIETTLATHNTRSFDRKAQQVAAPKGLQSYNREGSYWEPRQKHRKKPKLLLSSSTKRAPAKTKKVVTTAANTKTKRSREVVRAKTALNTSEISSRSNFSIKNDTKSKHHHAAAVAATTPINEWKDDSNDKAKLEFLKLRWSSVVPIDGLEPKQWSSKKKLHSDEYLKSRWKGVVPLRSPTNPAEEQQNRTATKILYQEACSLEFCSPIRNIRAKHVPLPSSN